MEISLHGRHRRSCCRPGRRSGRRSNAYPRRNFRRARRKGIAVSELRQAAAIAHSMWLSKRMGFVALLLVALVWSVLLRFTAPRLGADAQGALSYLPMALSLFLGFIFCTFTETDRRGRLEGFPARLFTLPVRTRVLIGAPILVAVTVISLIYILWAMLVLPDSALPLSWPIIDRKSTRLNSSHSQ